MTKEEYVRIVDRSSHRLFLIALSFLGNRTDAEDAIQEVFLRLWKKQEPFENDEHTDKFLTRVCINVCKNMLRSLSRRHCTSLDDAQSMFAFDCAQDFDVFNAVMSLPQKERAVVHLFYYEDMSVAEIADALHASESSVKTALHRARNHLKTSLEEVGNHE